LSEMPAVRMMAFENIGSEYWVVSMVLSGNPSKSRMTVLASRGVKTAAASRSVVQRNRSPRSIS
jgi:hypothetical protein